MIEEELLIEEYSNMYPALRKLSIEEAGPISLGLHNVLSKVERIKKLEKENRELRKIVRDIQNNLGLI
jgi:hypothetical protein